MPFLNYNQFTQVYAKRCSQHHIIYPQTCFWKLMFIPIDEIQHKSKDYFWKKKLKQWQQIQCNIEKKWKYQVRSLHKRPPIEGDLSSTTLKQSYSISKHCTLDFSNSPANWSINSKSIHVKMSKHGKTKIH